MGNQSTTTGINTALLLIVGLLVGGIAGYIVGQSRAVATTPRQSALNLNDVLPPESVYIVEGLTCPMPGCTHPLQVCQGDLPRQIRDWVNAQVAHGRDGQDIRAEIIRTHGANVQKLGTPSVYDTIKSITN